MSGHLIALVDPCRLLGRPSAALWLIKQCLICGENIQWKIYIAGPSYALSDTDKLNYKSGLFEREKILIILIKHSKNAYFELFFIFGCRYV